MKKIDLKSIGSRVRKPRPTDDIVLYNIATDLVMNDELSELVSLPSDCKLPEDLGLPGGLTVDDYYLMLGGILAEARGLEKKTG